METPDLLPYQDHTVSDLTKRNLHRLQKELVGQSETKQSDTLGDIRIGVLFINGNELKVNQNNDEDTTQDTQDEESTDSDKPNLNSSMVLEDGANPQDFELTGTSVCIDPSILNKVQICVRKNQEEQIKIFDPQNGSLLISPSQLSNEKSPLKGSAQKPDVTLNLNNDQLLKENDPSKTKSSLPSKKYNPHSIAVKSKIISPQTFKVPRFSNTIKKGGKNTSKASFDLKFPTF